MSRDRSQALLGLFSTREVVDLPTMREALGGVSAMTVFRYLRRVPYRRSYNHNGRYYTRHEPSRYDRWGLWSCGDIYFSTDGSLRTTVRRLACEAQAGATHRELVDRLRVRVHNTLLELVHKGEIGRGKLADVYVYLSTDPVVRQGQIQRREERIASAADEEVELDDALVIQVLLVLVRHPDSAAADVVRRLRGHSPPISGQQVRAVFTRYDLGKKKGPSIS
jgi:hypothetical protein